MNSIAEYRYAFERVEGLPGDALGIDHPMLIRSGITAGGIRLIDNGNFSLANLVTQGGEFFVRFDL